MGLIKEPKDIDFIIKSEPWSQEELKQFRAIMNEHRKKKLSKSRSRAIKKGTPRKTMSDRA